MSPHTNKPAESSQDIQSTACAVKDAADGGTGLQTGLDSTEQMLIVHGSHLVQTEDDDNHDACC